MFAKTLTMCFPHHLFFFKSIIFFIHGLLFKKFWNNNARGNLNRSLSNVNVSTSHSKFQKFTSLFTSKSNLSSHAIIFNVEETLLKSSSNNLFPYYMIVAFEGGSIFRAFILFLLYPVICFLDEEMGVKIMVMVCFFGIRKKSFRVGSSVLPVFFLEDVGSEGFEVLNECGMKVGVSSSFPQVMIEGFLKDYMEVDVVVGRRLKEFHGYFLGLLEEKRTALAMEEVLGEETFNKYRFIGMNSFKKFMDHHHNQLFSLCKEIYLVSKADKESWHHLPKNSYPKPLIFHDGRLALKPTPFSTLTLLTWLPYSLLISLLRIIIALSLPFNISIPTLAFLGLHLTVSSISTHSSKDSKSSQMVSNSNKGLLYVCNHRTLLDPLYLSFALKRKFTAVTYSLSRLSEILAPIQTVRLTRDRDRDRAIMENMLKQGDLVVCPEGTTCREPFLLRFSPLFSEMSDEIAPVAVDSHVGMFHGTTASGYKCLDPFFFMMNPKPSYTLTLLGKVSGLMSLNLGDEKSSFDVANHVQSEIGNVLGFKCTELTRKHKYLILAGNEGISR